MSALLIVSINPVCVFLRLPLVRKKLQAEKVATFVLAMFSSLKVHIYICGSQEDEGIDLLISQ